MNAVKEHSKYETMRNKLPKVHLNSPRNYNRGLFAAVLIRPNFVGRQSSLSVDAAVDSVVVTAADAIRMRFSYLHTAWITYLLLLFSIRRIFLCK